MTDNLEKKSFIGWMTERRNLGVWAVMFGWVLLIIQVLKYVTMAMGITVTDEIGVLLVVFLGAGMLIMAGVDTLADKTTGIRRD